MRDRPKELCPPFRVRCPENRGCGFLWEDTGGPHPVPCCGAARAHASRAERLDETWAEPSVLCLFTITRSKNSD